MELNGVVYRWRRKPVVNPRSSARPLLSGWRDAEIVPVSGAHVMSSTSSPVDSDPTRNQATVTRSLFVTPGADIRKGDGISLTLNSPTPDYLVETVPHADINPFTGWQPPLEVPLKGVEG